MMICSNCKESFSNDFVFCPLCGNKLKNQVVCLKCKKVLDDSYQFCPYCGTSITIQTKEESSSDKNGAADKIDSKGNSKEYKDTGAYTVCDSLSSFLEQKIEEIDSNYYIKDDITSFGINKTKPVYHAAIPQPVQQPLVEDSLGKKRELTNETTMNQKYYLLRHIYNDGRGKRQMIFNNKDQAEAFFRQVVYGDHSRHSQITLFECSDEGVTMLDGRRFRS